MMIKSASIILVLLTTAITFHNQNEIDVLLDNPFDLQKFKKIKGQSNSGGASKLTYYLKPDSKGGYYRFFLFRPMTGYKFINGGKEKIDVHREDGLEIITYKPFGKYQNEFFDPNETLIEVIARYNDRDLQELAFVGLDVVSLKNKLGEKFLRKNDCFIYTKNKKALTFKITNSSVEWVKYSSLNFELIQTNIPDELLKD